MVVKRDTRRPSLRPDRTALLCVDLQHLCCSPGFGGFADVSPQTWGGSEYAYYFRRIRELVCPNVATLQQRFRCLGAEVLHARICSLTADGRDRSVQHKALGTLAPPDSPESEFLADVAPMGDEIVFNKTACGVFNATNIEYVLRNIGIESLVVVGCETNECVESTARDASDRGFDVVVVEDATAAYTRRNHDNAIAAMNYTFAYIGKTDELLSLLV